MIKDSTARHLANSPASGKLQPASQALPQIDRLTGRLFTGLIAVIVVGFVVTLGFAAYRYFQVP